MWPHNFYAFVFLKRLGDNYVVQRGYERGFIPLNAGPN